MSNMTPAGYGAFSLAAMQHSVTLADTKAGFLLAGSVAFLIFMAKEAVSPGQLPAPTALVAMAALLTTAVLAAMTFRPRFSPPPEGSLAYWRSTAFLTEQTAITAASDLNLATEADRLVGAHLYGLACVCRSKYATLNLAFWAAVIAVCAFFVWRAGDAVWAPVAPQELTVEISTEVSEGCGSARSLMSAPGVRTSVTSRASC